MSERATRVDALKSWTDAIPFRFDYSAGVAGERFLRGLQNGKILAATCTKCGTAYMPPKMYCVDCFVPISKFVEVGPEGRIEAMTESHVDFYGARTDAPTTLGFISFKGARGGLIHRLEGPNLKVGAKVRPRFAPASERKGALMDIVSFEAL